MIDPLVYFLFVVFGVLLSGFIPFRWRPMALAILGLIFLSVLAPASAAFLLVVIVQAIGISFMVSNLERSNPYRKYLPYLILLNMFWVDYHNLLLGQFVATIGVSFSVIRIFMTSKHMVSNRGDLRREYSEWIFVSGFYMPALMVGPVFSGMDLRKQVQTGEVSQGRLSYLYRNLFWGLSLSILLTPLFFQMAHKLPEHGAYYPFYATFLFLQLFAAFWGQSLIAEMGSRLSGYAIPANFDQPWRARDIKEFWQRWHISMARFIMQFIFLPLSINKVNPKVATIAAFVFMGLWHEVKIGYIIWGVAHGLLMAYWPTRPENASKMRIWFERLLTIVLVINLSYIANYAFK